MIEEIALGNDKKSWREAILNNLGQRVILKDAYRKWLDGTLVNQGHDDEVYLLETTESKEILGLRYLDLNCLLIFRKPATQNIKPLYLSEPIGRELSQKFFK